MRVDRIRVPAAVLTAGLLALGSFASAGPARAATTFSVVNGTASAAADHELVGSGAFPNFSTGAVDNSFPLAHTRVDNSPSSEATASPADSGPLGQTGASQGGVNQPQYADSRYPPGGDPVTAGAPGGPFAQSQAKENEASAMATAASVPPGATTSSAPATANATTLSSTASAPPAAPDTEAAAWTAVRAALVEWRKQFLTSDDANRYPFADAASAASDAPPDGTDGDTASSSARFDPKNGQLILHAESHVHYASFGSGAFALSDLSMVASVTNDGTPSDSSDVTVGRATLGGVPVVINQSGVSINGTLVPGIADAKAQAEAALNGLLAQAGITIATVEPTITKSTNQERLHATGVEVRWEQQVHSPGVPEQFADHVLGEAFVDSLAVPGTPPGSISAEPAPVSLSGGDTFDSAAPAASAATVTDSASAAVPVVSSPQPTAKPAPRRAPTGTALRTAPAAFHVASKRWLLLLYLLWQISVLGTMASLWWWRQEARA